MKAIYAIVVFVCLQFYLYAAPLVVKVVGISDGDTIEVLGKDNKTFKVRLAHIDCPEKKQAFGMAAKQHTASMCFGKTAQLHISSYDRNHRAIADVYIGELYVNLELVKSGLAWHFKKYSSSEVFANAEVNAKKQKIGLWSDANPTAPWDFRHSKK